MVFEGNGSKRQKKQKNVSDEGAREFPAKKEAVGAKRNRVNDLDLEVTGGNYKKGADAENSSMKVLEIADDDLDEVQSSGDKVGENTEIEEYIVSSEEDWDEFRRKNDFLENSESEDSTESDGSTDSDDSDYVVDASDESQDNSESDESQDNLESEDEENVGNQSLKKKKKGQTRRKQGSYSAESLKRKGISERMEKGRNKKKRENYSDEIQQSSEYENEPTNKSKYKFKKSSREVRSCEREICDKKYLKRKKALGRMSHERTVSSRQSAIDEAWTKKDDMNENTSFYDSDKDPISSIYKRERLIHVEVKKPTTNARRDCNLQNDNSDEESEEEEETDKLIRKPTYHRKKYDNEGVYGEEDNKEGGEESEKGEEPTVKSVSEGKDDKEEAEETENIEESTKRRRSFGKKDDPLSTLLKELLEEEPNEEEVLEENAEAKPSSPVEETLPYKFSFPDDDEFPPEKEKDYWDLEAEGLFAAGFGSSEPLKSDSESKDEETQYARCRKEKHAELYLDEEIGLICSFCRNLVVDIKFVLGDLVDRPERTSRRDYYREKEDRWYYDDALEASGSYYQEACNLSKGTVWDLVPGIRDEMYPHQQEGIEFLWKSLKGTIDLAELKNSDLSGGGGCIISHAPGCGKTRLTIVFLETYLKLFPDCRPVIIAPVSIILTWEEEFEKWGFKYPFYNLNNRENNNCSNDLLRVGKMTNWKKHGGVLGLSYSLFEKLAGEKFTKEKGKNKKKQREKAAVDENLKMLRSILLEMPGLVILDEGHKARNKTSGIWNALSNIKTEKCIILSGTPFQNNFEELSNTLSLVRPEIASKLSGEKAFDKQRRNVGAELDKAIEKLRTEIAPFVHVHKGDILQKNLPGLRDSVVILSPDLLQEGLIESMENLQRNTFEYDHKVAMVSVHPSLLLHCRNLSEKEKSCFNQTELEKMKLDYGRGVKTRFVTELIRLSEALGEKNLIFSQYVQPLKLIKDQLEKAFSWKDGKQILHIKGMLDQKQRQKIINAFNDPKSTAKVMLASTKCCSEGIHLVGASRVVLLDVVWNPSVERQAICWAYRIGQEKVVYTYHLITAGTGEGEKYMRQAKKDRISELVFSASSPSKTAEEGKEKELVEQLDDQILKDMVGETRFKDMFKKFILQPKETNFLESFGSESFF